MQMIPTFLMIASVSTAMFFQTSCVAPISSNSAKISQLTRDYSAPRNYAQHRAQQHKYQSSIGTLAYTDHGSKSSKNTIVMIHGVPTNSWAYRKIIPSLQQSHRVVTVDLLGYGFSSKPKNSGSNYSPQSQASAVRALLKTIGVNQYTVMMHDMGGLVAWEMMRQDSSAVKNLVVLNTIVTKDGFDHPKMKPGVMTKLITNAYSSPLSSSAILTMTFRHMGLTGADRLNRGECKGYVTPLKEGSSAALYAFFTSLNPKLYQRLDSHQATLHKFKGKTLVLWGAEDKNLTTRQIPYLKKHLSIPSSNINIYPTGGHLLTEEIPDEIIQKVNQFLR